MLRWLIRLFRPQRTDAEGAVAAVAPAPEPAVIALPQLGLPTVPPIEEEKVAMAVAPAAALEARETCPDCGRPSVFAGPPGHRYCMHCALRQELFDSKTASN